MNIIIPLCGRGERFKSSGYTDPKPLINVFGKPMLFYVLDNLNLTMNDNIYIIVNDKSLFEQIISDNYPADKYPNIRLIELSQQTSGASETLYLGLKSIIAHTEHTHDTHTQHTKTILMDCDTFYTQDVLSMYKKANCNAVYYTNNVEKNPIYSYITLYGPNVSRIAEKHKISDYANTGIYAFVDIYQLAKYAEYVVLNKIFANGECYISCIIDEMLKDKHIFAGIELDSRYVFNLGTPTQLTKYVNSHYIFLFDLDGTVILSENIYFDVWKTILADYNISLTPHIFQKYISGNNDKTAIENILPNNKTDVSLISKRKDELYLQNINQIKLVPGILNALSIIKQNGHKIALVTNCNRVASEAILIALNISDYFEFIIVGNECKRSKPYPDPYNEAIHRFGGSNKQAIIFEDSKTGLLSAHGVSPKCIVGIETIYSAVELKHNFAHITMPNYLDFDITKLINYIPENNNTLTRYIKQSLNMDIRNIWIDDTKLKGGFISDVIELKITTDILELNCVLKLENKNENFLSVMSNKLDLYGREYYFYESIANYVPVRFPKCYGLIKDDNFNNIGILMENLNTSDYVLNLNLNQEKIETSLTIINKLAELHSKFWNKPILNAFDKLKKNNDKLFNPFWPEFITDKYPLFKSKWSHLLTEKQIELADYIAINYTRIQHNLSHSNLTFCHGDVKSPNIFYKTLDNQKQTSQEYEPYFIDWQYITNGKGVQDLVFFMIESFDIDKMKLYKSLFKEYYYIKLTENGIHYNREDYNSDFKYASYYFPFFVAVWFGTISEDELIDKSFPFEFIKKLFNFYSISV